MIAKNKLLIAICFYCFILVDSSPLTEASERRECNEPRIFLTEKANASREEFTVLDHDVNGRGTVSESPCSDDTEFSEPSLQAEDNDVVRGYIFCYYTSAKDKCARFTEHCVIENEWSFFISSYVVNLYVLLNLSLAFLCRLTQSRSG